MSLHNENPAPENEAPNQQPPPGDHPPQQQKLPAIALDEQGLVKLETLADELTVCRNLVSAQMVPESLNTPGKLFAARQLCRELNLPVMSAIRQVAVVNGSPSLWGDTPLAIVRRSGQLAFMREFLVAADYTEISLEHKNLDAEPFAAVCEVQRVGEERRTFCFTVKQAKTANLWGKKVWAAYPLRMLTMKARGLALKNTFPDVLMGVGLAEYDFDQIPGVQARDVNAETSADKANSMFGVDADPLQEQN